MQYKGREIHPYESFYWSDTEAFFRGEYGGGIARCVKTDDSLAIMEDKVRIPQATKEGFIECEVGGVFDGSYPDSTTRRGRVQGGGSISPTLTCNCDGLRRIEPQILRKFRTEEQKERRRIMKDKGIKFSEASKAPAKDGCSNTLTSVQKDNLLAEPFNADGDCSRTIKAQYAKTGKANFDSQGSFGATGAIRDYRIRKLTPRECFRLMGVDDKDIDKLLGASISNSKLYKCAGNSIVVDVLYHLLRKIYVEQAPDNGVQTLF